MRPIDVIRTKMDPDLLKYHSTRMCYIPSRDSIKSIRGVGTVINVKPIVSQIVDDSQDDVFPVVITNTKFLLGWEVDTHLKYYVNVISSPKDNYGFCSGYLVPVSIPGSVENSQEKNIAEKKEDSILSGSHT